MAPRHSSRQQRQAAYARQNRDDITPSTTSDRAAHDDRFAPPPPSSAPASHSHSVLHRHTRSYQEIPGDDGPRPLRDSEVASGFSRPDPAQYRSAGSHYEPTQQTSFSQHSMERSEKPPAQQAGRGNGKASIRDDVRAYIRRKRAKKQGRRLNETWRQRMRARLKTFYKKTILETILRQKPLPPSKDGRHIPLDSSSRGPNGLIDERRGKPYISNFIRSSRYTLYDFIPKQLIFQFSKLGNFYFLIIGVLQLVPGLSTVGTWTTIAPLAFFVAFSMLKEGFDDYRRYRLDRAENRSHAWVLTDGSPRQAHQRKEKNKKNGRRREGAAGDDMMLDDLEARTPDHPNKNEWQTVLWQDVRVGDVIRLRRDENVPADIAMLHATGPNGVAYIETMALDGETNLKSKQACTLLAKRCSTIEGIRTTRAVITSEDPNLDLYSYDGKVTVDDETVPLSLNNVIYRGSTIRNTDETIGLVINTGEECKIRMNANKNVKAKKPAMHSTINKMVMYQIFLVCMLTMGLTIGYYLWRGNTERHSWYIYMPGQWDAGVSYTHIFFGYLIMFNTLVPLSLYISLEIIKIGQLVLLQDVEMYDPVSDTPMVANTTTILENLGQVSYVFTDKTGTLTENIMRFRKLSVAGVAVLHDMDMARDEEAKRKRMELRNKSFVNESEHQRPDPSRNLSMQPPGQWTSSVHADGKSEMKTEELIDHIRKNPTTAFSLKAKRFLLCLALCHTCLPEKKDDGSIEFQAASPDELALVEAARDLGYMVIDRPSQAIILETHDDDGAARTETYQVLDVIEFSSKRKRMSIIIRMPDGRICIFCKGADNVIMSRLKLNQLAEDAATEIGRQSSLRRTSEQGRALQRRSTQSPGPYNSQRNSFTLRRRDSADRTDREGVRLSFGRRSSELKRLSDSHPYPAVRSPRASMDAMSPVSPMSPASPASPGGRPSHPRYQSVGGSDPRVDESIAANEGATFEKTFQHTNEFASDGLRTLLYGYRYIDKDAYLRWKEVYREAETSLTDRQKRVEEASELIERKFELAGATAIEDKLQDGVPDVIDKLRRANIKIWMLTGDKRETAINIGQSARVCKPYSEVYVLDSTEGNLHDTMTSVLADVEGDTIPHSVVVVDGGTLAVIDADEDLAAIFYDLAIRVDSVICCRASPSQKARLVKSIRRFVPKTMTLAIGDGANDIGMIQASHVGIGISGREGLQAARISDFSIAQFRFLQKLLLVHGRWNYMRTGKYVLATFWKEILFFLVQAHFQRFNGYSGTSLYEQWSLTVFNTFFTSLPVILMGIFDKDLSAETLLKVPELYTFGQRGYGFNFFQYFGWAIMAVGSSFLIWYFTESEWLPILFDDDNALYAMGVVCFTVAVIFINTKILILEVHTKTVVTSIGWLVSVGGWFLWMLILTAAYTETFGPYVVRKDFLDNFGRRLAWWTTVLLEIVALISVELAVQAIRRVYWPSDQDLMQRLEKDGRVGEVFRDSEEAVENDKGCDAAREVEVEREREREREVEREQEQAARRDYDEYRPHHIAPLREERENPMEQQQYYGRAF